MSKEKIYIVEDEKLIAMAITARLERLGYQVCGRAVNAHDALSALQTLQPDLVLMDIMIDGDMDGIELAKIIIERYGTPVIYLTAYSDQDILDRAKQTLPYGYLTKPVQERDLKITFEIAFQRIKVEKELNRAKTSLKNIEEKLLGFYQSIPVGIYRVAADGTLLMANPAFAKINGYSSFSDLKKHNFRFDKAFRKPNTREYLKTMLLQHGEVKGFKTQFITKNGKRIWVRGSARMYKNALGEAEYYEGILEDVTLQEEIEYKLLINTIEVQENERNRFSRELHDGLGPVLAAIKLYFQWLAKNNDPTQNELIIEKGMKAIDTAILEARQISHGLNPSTLTKNGLFNTLQSLVKDITMAGQIQINFQYNISGKLNHTIEITLYRIISELINNTLKHSAAKNVWIECTADYMNQTVKLSYRDNGSGFPFKGLSLLPQGFGLSGIHTRVEALKGKMFMDSSPGKGIEVFIEIPAETLVENNNSPVMG